MKEMFEQFMERVFGVISKKNGPSITEIEPEIKSIVPEKKLTFNEWAQELSVSQSYQR